MSETPVVDKKSEPRQRNFMTNFSIVDKNKLFFILYFLFSWFSSREIQKKKFVLKYKIKKFWNFAYLK